MFVHWTSVFNGIGQKNTHLLFLNTFGMNQCSMHSIWCSFSFCFSFFLYCRSLWQAKIYSSWKCLWNVAHKPKSHTKWQTYTQSRERNNKKKGARAHTQTAAQELRKTMIGLCSKHPKCDEEIKIEKRSIRWHCVTTL